MPSRPVSVVFRSLRFRLTVWNTAVVVLTVGAALLGVREGLRHTLLRETDQLLDEDAQEIVEDVADAYPDMQAVFHVLDRKAAAHVHRGLFVQLIDPGGKIIRSTAGTPAANQSAPTGSAPAAGGGSFRTALRTVHKVNVPPFQIRVGASLANVEDDLATLTRLMLIAGAAILLLAPWGGYWLAGRATHPLEDILRAADRLRPSHMEERLPIRHTGDQLDQLSHTINRFLDQIADYVARNREFVANAAHELRSPLAAIQSSVEVALNADRSTGEYKDLLYEIVDECSRLGVLVDQLLLLAESDAGVMRFEREMVSLDQMVATSLDMFRGAAEERGIELTSQRGAPIAAAVDAGRMRQVVNNLIDNALKFTPPGGCIHVGLSRDVDGGGVVLFVADTGSGIAAEELPHIFDRFYRGDKSRHRDDPGSGNGLGLSICQSIVAAHGGDIRVESTIGQGSTFTVRLPLGEPPPTRSAAQGAALTP